MEIIRFLKQNEIEGINKTKIFERNELGRIAFYTDLAALMGVEDTTNEEFMTKKEMN